MCRAHQNINKTDFYLISLMKRYTPQIEGEIDEQDSPSSSGAGAGTNLNTRGRKWETGLTRGPANPIGNTKRQDKVNRGKANTLI